MYVNSLYGVYTLSAKYDSYVVIFCEREVPFHAKNHRTCFVFARLHDAVAAVFSDVFF